MCMIYGKIVRKRRTCLCHWNDPSFTMKNKIIKIVCFLSILSTRVCTVPRYYFLLRHNTVDFVAENVPPAKIAEGTCALFFLLDRLANIAI